VPVGKFCLGNYAGAVLKIEKRIGGLKNIKKKEIGFLIRDEDI